MLIVRPWDSQPQEVVDFSAEIAASRIWSLQPAIDSGYAKTLTSAGVEAAFSGSTSITVPNTSGAFSDGLWILIAGRRTVNSGVQPLFARERLAATGGFELALYNQYGSPAAAVWPGATGATFSQIFVNGDSVSIGGTYATAADSLYAVACQLTSISSNANDIKLGEINFGSWYLTGSILTAHIGRGVLPNELLREWTRDVWRAYQPRRLWFPVTAGGSTVTIDCSPGNAVAAGPTATISTNVGVACSVGNAVAAGVAASIVANSSVACSVGNAVANGVACSIIVNERIDCSVGDGTAAGVGCTVTNSNDVTINCGVGNAAAAGISCNVASNETVNCGVGAGTAAGVTCTVTNDAVTITINCAVGNAAANGVPCSISGGAVSQDATGGWYGPTPKSAQRIRRDRIKYGVIPPDVVKAAEKVAEKAVEQAGDSDPVEYFQERKQRFEKQLKAELAEMLEPPTWADSFSNQIRIQIEQIIAQREQEDEDLLLMLL